MFVCVIMIFSVIILDFVMYNLVQIFLKLIFNFIYSIHLVRIFLKLIYSFIYSIHLIFSFMSFTELSKNALCSACFLSFSSVQQHSHLCLPASCSLQAITMTCTSHSTTIRQNQTVSNSVESISIQKYLAKNNSRYFSEEYQEGRKGWLVVSFAVILRPFLLMGIII